MAMTRLSGMTGPGGAHERVDAVRNRTAILEAAVAVLAVEPSASLSEVATRAGLGRATLYRHFPSREDLRAAIREEALTRASAALEEARLEECSVREGVRRAAAALLPLGMRFRILLAEGADTDPGFLAAREQALRPLSNLVLRGVADGELDPGGDPTWAALVLASLLTSAVRAASLGSTTVEDAPDLVCTAFFDGFGRGRAGRRRAPRDRAGGD